ncbi:MAG: sulfite exporter TauE/SafE family protein [Desulfobulbales bacterium]
MPDLTVTIYLLAVLFCLVAFFYASVGLGGGSSYTALLAVFGVNALSIPMISLALNLLVTTIGSLLFLQQKHSKLKLIAPFLVSSIPMAYLGGALQVPRELFYMILWLSLLFAAWRIYFPGDAKPLPLGPRGKLILSLAAGGVLGLVAGIVGIGGGVYLVPLIILLGLGSAKEAAACGAVFIWVNSFAGILARMQHNSIDPAPYLPLFAAVLFGGIAGSYMGSTRFVPRTMQKILGSILIVAVFFLGRKIVGIYV